MGDRQLEAEVNSLDFLASLRNFHTWLLPFRAAEASRSDNLAGFCILGLGLVHLSLRPL